MNSLISAIRRHRRLAALALLLLSGADLRHSSGPGQRRSRFAHQRRGRLRHSLRHRRRSIHDYISERHPISFPATIWESGGHSTTSNAEVWTVDPNAASTGAVADGAYWYPLSGSSGFVSGTWTVKVDNYEGAATAAAYTLQVAFWPGTIGQTGGQAGGTMRNGETYSGTRR